MQRFQAEQGLRVVEMFPLQPGRFCLVFPINSIPGFRPGEDDQHK